MTGLYSRRIAVVFAAGALAQTSAFAADAKLQYRVHGTQETRHGDGDTQRLITLPLGSRLELFLAAPPTPTPPPEPSPTSNSSPRPLSVDVVAGAHSCDVPVSSGTGCSVALVAEPSGGLEPYAYEWSGCARSSAARATCSVSNVGTSVATVTVTDARQHAVLGTKEVRGVRAGDVLRVQYLPTIIRTGRGTEFEIPKALELEITTSQRSDPQRLWVDIISPPKAARSTEPFVFVSDSIAYAATRAGTKPVVGAGLYTPKLPIVSVGVAAHLLAGKGGPGGEDVAIGVGPAFGFLRDQFVFGWGWDASSGARRNMYFHIGISASKLFQRKAQGTGATAEPTVPAPAPTAKASLDTPTPRPTPAQ